MDIFKGWIWYAYKENPVIWHKLTLEQTNQIIEMNKKNNKVNSLEEFSSEHDYENEVESVFTDVVGQDSLTRFRQAQKRAVEEKKAGANRKGNFRGSGSQATGEGQ